jgi:FtsP/CotA-like multicopper oxidase with cupredoxin domain
VVQFFEVPAGKTNFDNAISGPLDFNVIGSDQGLTSSPRTVNTLVMETGSRYDIIFDFDTVTEGNRVIMKNIGGDSPFGFSFGDDLEPEDVFPDRQTDRIMAFDVVLPPSGVTDVAPTGTLLAQYDLERAVGYDVYNDPTPARTRRVALFEGTDEFGRLQPLLGTAAPATDWEGNAINWPDDSAENGPYSSNGLTGQMEGSIAWHSPTTENPALGDTEVWEVANVTGDAHPIHLHLVHFEVVSRHEIIWDSETTEENRVLDDSNQAAGDGTYLLEQPVVQHNGTVGGGFKVVNLTYVLEAIDDLDPAYVDADLPKDMVSALPGQVTKIKATFDKPGRYVWHCHILSHEDHEMMRVLHVGPGAHDG